MKIEGGFVASERCGVAQIDGATSVRGNLVNFLELGFVRSIAIDKIDDLCNIYRLRVSYIKSLLIVLQVLQLQLIDLVNYF